MFWSDQIGYQPLSEFDLMAVVQPETGSLPPPPPVCTCLTYTSRTETMPQICHIWPGLHRSGSPPRQPHSRVPRRCSLTSIGVVSSAWWCNGSRQCGMCSSSGRCAGNSSSSRSELLQAAWQCQAGTHSNNHSMACKATPTSRRYSASSVALWQQGCGIIRQLGMHSRSSSSRHLDPHEVSSQLLIIIARQTLCV